MTDMTRELFTSKSQEVVTAVIERSYIERNTTSC